ncbi:hypothetical protein AB0H71_31345 [Nocardia sp. NPDC050697]
MKRHFMSPSPFSEERDREADQSEDERDQGEFGARHDQPTVSR